MIYLGQYTPPENLEQREEYMSIPEEFKYHFEYADTCAEADLLQSVAIKLKHKLCHRVSGIITLLFDVVLAPSRPFK